MAWSCQTYQHCHWWQPRNSTDLPYFMDYFHSYLSDCQTETWLILLESIRYQFWTGQMTMAWWNASGNGRKRWKFHSKVTQCCQWWNQVQLHHLLVWRNRNGVGGQWETEGKITDANRNQVDRYFTLFEEHILPKSNALIMIVELKRLFQGSISLEDFHTKALRLVKEGEYPEGDTWNRILRDIIISGLASDKIWAKIIKEGKDDHTGQSHGNSSTGSFHPETFDRMQETATGQLCALWERIQEKERANQDPVVAVAAVVCSGGSRVNAGNTGKPSGKGKKVPLPTDICWRCGKGRHQKGQPCKAVEAVCRNYGTKGHYEKVCMKKSTHLVDVPGTYTDSDLDYFNEHWDPVYLPHTHGSC